MRHRRSSAGESGFTLLELLVVLTIAALLATLVGPNLAASVAHARLQTSGERLVDVLRELRSTAMKTAAPTRLVIEGAGQHVVANGKDYPLRNGEKLSLHPFSADGASTSRELRFLPDGSASGGKLILSNSGAQCAIEIDWLTGRIGGCR